ncbi:lysine transporter LysE [Desulfovibrio psychrotolerans]|uniref:Lysine transporter LysE n=2 Tax=Desulfovibrio psychrotolerans TaxID=415242 RepID=A0A7J0BX71_9BACT|nr:lysine transporter LysE [Desulfovibrio psychrotolerans]
MDGMAESILNGIMGRHFLPLFLFCVTMCATPGPNNIMLTASGANFGFRRTVPHMLGITLGVQSMILVIGLGLGRLFTEYPAVHAAMEWVGGAYLLYLAWKIATIPPTAGTVPVAEPAAGSGTGPEAGNAGIRPAGRPFSFTQALLFQWVNPKCWMMIVGALASFSVAGGGSGHNPGSVAATVAGVAFIALGFLSAAPAIALWAYAGVKIRRFLETSLRQRVFNGVMAGLLVGSLALVHASRLV